MFGNMDIKAADGSNYAPVFNILEEAMDVDSRYQDHVHGAFDQLWLPIKVRNPVIRKGLKRESVRLTPTQQTLYSGSTLTTTTNNMANTLIFLAFMKVYSPRYTKKRNQRLLELAAEKMGYIVRFDLATNYQELQFLKHSPARGNDGSIQAVLNIGVWLRGFGSCPGDLPGKKGQSLEERAKIYDSEIIRGRVHAGNHPIKYAFDTKVVSQRVDVPQNERWRSWLEMNISGRQTAEVSLEELAKRYDVSVLELEELCDGIRRLRYGSQLSLRCISVIMDKDYGYSPFTQS